MATIEDFIRNYRDANAFNYSVHISEEFGFIYFNNPKAGCSTTKATLNLACARKLGKELHYTAMADIHARKFNLLKSPNAIGAQRFLEMVSDVDVVKLCILRDPISRTCSAFASKFRGRNSPHRQRLNERLGRPAEAPWDDVNAFVDAIASDVTLRDFDEHWRSQYRQVCGAQVDFSVVGFQEELESSLHKIMRRLFGDEDLEIFDVRGRFPTNVSKSGLAAAALSPASRDALLRAYADDVAFYEREWKRMHAP